MSEREIELKPCPFCGQRQNDDRPGRQGYGLAVWPDMSRFCVRCSFCEAQQGDEDTMEQAAEWWNRRPDEWDALLAQAEREIPEPEWREKELSGVKK